MNRCVQCKKNFAGKSGICGSCQELNEERDLRTNLQSQLMAKDASIASMKRYRVHHPSAVNQNGDLSWPEAVELAKRWLDGVRPWRVEIHDPNGRVVRAWERKESTIVEVQVA